MKKIFLVLPLLLSFHTEAKSLKVMQYNAENFFNTGFDEGTDDYTYLPLFLKHSLPGQAAYCETLKGNFRQACLNLDWTDEKFESKALNIAKVIRAFDASGRGPDVIVLEEVENEEVLKEIIKKGLPNLGYNYKVLIEGDDSRGIDVGVISRFPVISSKRYPIYVDGQRLDTRGITEVVLNVEGKKVAVYGNHWPSQNNPVTQRIESAKTLMKAADAMSADLVIALGDFNTIPKDTPSPFAFLTNFIDSEKEARKLNPSLHPGTHYFRGEWTSLDKIFVHKSSRLQADYKTYRIVKEPFMMTTDAQSGQSIPLRSDANRGTGFSDHLPIGIEFIY